MKNKLQLATILGVTAISNLHSEELTKPANPLVDPCVGIYQRVTTLVASEPERVVEIVSTEVAANQSCSCEVVKAAIKQSKPEVTVVAAIVEAAILAAPEQMRITAQCAIAAAPDATAEVNSVVARLDPNSGDGATQGAKSAIREDAKSGIGENPRSGISDVAHVPNPLDFPGQGTSGSNLGDPTLIGPTPAGSIPASNGANLIPQIIPSVTNPPAPAVINPPVVTPVNP